MEQPKLYRLADGSLFPILAGAKGPSAPPPDPGLVSKQNELLQMQIDTAKQSKALEPMLLKEAGLKWNDQTKSYEDIDPTLTSNKREIERMQTERSLKALRGELPVSETLKRSLSDGQQRLDEEMFRQMGPGYKGSTAGITKQREYDTMATMLKEGEQRDMMTTAEALALQRGSSRSVTANQFENPFASQARMLAPAQQSLASARDQDNFSRSMKFEQNKLAGQERAGYISAGLGLAGMGAGMFMMSDPEMKTDIEPVSDAALLSAVTKIPVKRWKYKDDPEGREHIGGMADTMPEVVSDGHVVDVISYIGMLTGAVRELNRKISADEEMSPGMALAF